MAFCGLFDGLSHWIDNSTGNNAFGSFNLFILSKENMCLISFILCFQNQINIFQKATLFDLLDFAEF